MKAKHYFRLNHNPAEEQFIELLQSHFGKKRFTSYGEKLLSLKQVGSLDAYIAAFEDVSLHVNYPLEA
ncbi:hypothetical protein ACLOJK_010010 [Asimina triloba]